MKKNWISAIALSITAAIGIIIFSEFVAPAVFQVLNPETAAVQAQQLPPSPELPEAPDDLSEAPPSPKAVSKPTPSPSPSPSPAATVPPKPSPSPSPSPSPKSTPSPSPSPTATPSPKTTPSPSPSPTATPSPKTTPSPSPSPTPTVNPTPQLSPSTPAVESPALPRLPLADVPYTDTTMGYRLGILEGYKAVSLGGVTAIASPDGNLAYTVTARQRAVDSPLTPASLAQIAIDTFARGEGFVADKFESTIGGTRIPWKGTLMQDTNQQALSGLILARQVPGKVLILLIAATETAKGQVESVLATVAPTLESVER
ncbi:hypothetical protein [Oscillatoria sp. FACHB-1406]|uniref:hypothetical protein n=1 Tax=Oscillatoria sp. FACHB-1406 TaxID=2692846 RepID=UPI0016823B67|nr:hypothetical protein [Oscillatoria sp. FACHB-1406]MBD2580358.1 hypothetical protein [Oscillatoria sp. FACHB-1406]